VEDIRIHGKDERILVKSFNDGVVYLCRFVKALASNHGKRHRSVARAK